MLKVLTDRTKIWAIVILALLAAYFLWFEPHSARTSQSQPDPALSHALNECDGITEKAALALPPAKLEFQKLEQAGRKARVFRLCMSDRGYRESPHWTDYAQPLAKQVAEKSQVSMDEAMENLRRADMVKISMDPDAPAYWVSTHSR